MEELTHPAILCKIWGKSVIISRMQHIGVGEPMDKSFFYTVEASEVNEFKKMLDLMKIPYTLEPPIALLKEGSNLYAFVFPNMSLRLYGMVRKLFKSEAQPYPK